MKEGQFRKILVSLASNDFESFLKKNTNDFGYSEDIIEGLTKISCKYLSCKKDNSSGVLTYEQFSSYRNQYIENVFELFKNV